MYTLDLDLSVRAVAFGEDFVFNHLLALAVVPSLNNELDVLKMDLGMFKQASRVVQRIGFDRI